MFQTDHLKTPTGEYYGEDVLEGFAADAEHLGKQTENSTVFDKKYYNLCKLDNLYIFELEPDSNLQIPPMSMNNS